jgi:hypothetical protein
MLRPYKNCGPGGKSFRAALLLGGRRARLHGRLAEEKSLVVGVAETLGLLDVGCGFDFFGEEMNSARGIASGDAGAKIVTGGEGIHFKEVNIGDQRVPARTATSSLSTTFSMTEIGSRLQGFQNFQDDFLRREEFMNFAVEGGGVDVIESHGGANESLHVEEHSGVDDDVVDDAIGGTETVFGA